MIGRVHLLGTLANLSREREQKSRRDRHTVEEGEERTSCFWEARNDVVEPTKGSPSPSGEWLIEGFFSKLYII